MTQEVDERRRDQLGGLPCQVADLYDTSAGQYFAEEPCNRTADRLRRILLQEVCAFDRHFLLVGKPPAKFALRADQKAARIAVDEELGYGACR